MKKRTKRISTMGIIAALAISTTLIVGNTTSVKSANNLLIKMNLVN